MIVMRSPAELLGSCDSKEWFGVGVEGGLCG